MLNNNDNIEHDVIVTVSTNREAQDQINITGYKKQIQEITGHNATATCTGGLKNHDDNNSINKMQTV